MNAETPAPPTDFAEFGLLTDLLGPLEKAGLKHPSPIQAAAIPALLDGRDVLLTSQTGSGKTAAYALPILHTLAATPVARQPLCPSALVLAPARELASQIAGVFRTLGRPLPLRTRVASGGLPRETQINALAEGTDILVATPGRLVELLEGGNVILEQLRFLVLDEADRLIEGDLLIAMGRIAPYLDHNHQTIFCSATQPDTLRDLAKRLLHNPLVIEMAEQTPTPKRIRQHVAFSMREEKPKQVRAALHGLGTPAMIFTRTKADAEKLASFLRKDRIRVETLHGDKTQGARSKALDALRNARVDVLIATDVAARGLDIPDVRLVVSVDVPDQPETYVHRIGRTARAGKSGAAVVLCDPDERTALRAIEKHMGYRIRVTDLTAEALTPRRTNTR